MRKETGILGLNLPRNVWGRRLFLTKGLSPVQIFDRCVTEIFKKFPKEIEQMQRLGISKKIITEAILDGRFSLLLCICFNKTNLEVFARYLPTGLMHSETHFTISQHLSSTINEIISYCKYFLNLEIALRQRKLSNEKNKLHPIRDFEKIKELVKSRRTLSDSRLVSILEFAFSQIPFLHSGIEFNCNYTPSSELNIDDIKKIKFSPGREIVFITIILEDGRVLKRIENIVDAFYIKQIPEIREKISGNTDFMCLSSNLKLRRPWTANHIVEMLRTSLFECPFTFEGIIGSKVKQLEEDIMFLNPLNIRFCGFQDVTPKTIKKWFRTMGHEDYVNFMLHSFKKYLPEFTKAGFEMEQIRKATADGNFLLLLRVCRTGLSNSEMRNLYEKTSMDEEAKKDFIETCKNELKEHEKDIAFCRPLEVQSGVIHSDSRKSSDFRNIPDELGIYLAKKHQRHLMSNYAKDNPEMFQNLKLVAVLAHQGRLKEEDVDKIWKDPSSEEAKKIVERAKDLIQADLSEWESIFELMKEENQVILVCRVNEWKDVRNTYMTEIINQGRWYDERKLFIKIGPSVKSARNLRNQ